jgi:hypothetical protein
MSSRTALANLRFRALDEAYVRQNDPSRVASAILATWSRKTREGVERMTEKQFRKMYAGEMIRTSQRFRREKHRFQRGQRRTHRILAGMTTRFEAITSLLVEVVLLPSSRRLAAE